MATNHNDDQHKTAASSPALPESSHELEAQTIAAMLRYQRCLAAAQAFHNRVEMLRDSCHDGEPALIRAEATCLRANRRLDRQEQFLAGLLERLGYVPRLPERTLQ